MLSRIETGSPNVIGFELTGTRHDAGYQQFVQLMETILTAEGKIRLFVKYEDFPGWDLYAAWEDFNLSLRQDCGFERIAIVGDHKWEKLMAIFCKPFTKAKVTYFDKSQVNAAWKWLRDNDEDDRATKGNDRTLDVPDNPDWLSTCRWSGL